VTRRSPPLNRAPFHSPPPAARPIRPAPSKTLDSSTQILADDASQAPVTKARSKILFPALDLGPLPVELVGEYLLQRHLVPGIGFFSAANQDHAFERHGPQFLKCVPHLAATVLYPHYIGQSPLHPLEFEMVRLTSAKLGLPQIYVLVAVTLDIDGLGRYAIQSVYPIGRGTVERRVRKRHLFPVPYP
jgi:hypothetical protein